MSALGRHSARAVAQGDVLVDCPYFAVSRLELRGLQQIKASSTHTYLIVIEGTCNVSGESTKAGEGWYIPPGSTTEVAGTAISLLIRAH